MKNVEKCWKNVEKILKKCWKKVPDNVVPKYCPKIWKHEMCDQSLVKTMTMIHRIESWLFYSQLRNGHVRQNWEMTVLHKIEKWPCFTELKIDHVPSLRSHPKLNPYCQWSNLTVPYSQLLRSTQNWEMTMFHRIERWLFSTRLRNYHVLQNWKLTMFLRNFLRCNREKMGDVQNLSHFWVSATARLLLKRLSNSGGWSRPQMKAYTDRNFLVEFDI